MCSLLWVAAATAGEASPGRLVYAALGDSIARGWGVHGPVPGPKKDSCGNVLPPPAPPFDLSRWDAPERAYPARLARLIATSTHVSVELDNLACSGETTKQLLGRDSARLAEVEARKPDVVTVDTGADDLLWSCGIWRAAWKFVTGLADPENVTVLVSDEARGLHSRLFGGCSDAKVAAGLASVARNLPLILSELASHTRAQIFVATYYDSTGSRADRVVERRLNRAIEQAVAAAGPRVHLVPGAEQAFAAHDCRAPRPQRWMLVWDICLHPNDAGQQALARIFYDRIAPFLPRHAAGSR